MSRIIIPYSVSDTEYSLFIGIDNEAFARMRKHDPVEVTMARYVTPLASGLKLRDIQVGYVDADDIAHLVEMTEAGATHAEILAYLMRGYIFDPTLGDGAAPEAL